MGHVFQIEHDFALEVFGIAVWRRRRCLRSNDPTVSAAGEGHRVTFPYYCWKKILPITFSSSIMCAVELEITKC